MIILDENILYLISELLFKNSYSTVVVSWEFSYQGGNQVLLFQYEENKDQLSLQAVQQYYRCWHEGE